MRSSKSRSRGNKNRNNRPTGGNVINRVFDSSGPDGKVRGTPQQIIEKYLQLHRDAQLSGDRVNAENFAQHAEHYTRILAEAQREVDRQREEQEQYNRDRQAERDRERAQRNRNNDYAADPAMMDQPDVEIPLGEEMLVDVVESADQQMVDLPEGKPSFLGNRQDRGERRQPRERQDRGDRQERGERQDRGERQERGERQDRRNNDRPARERNFDRQVERAEAPVSEVAEVVEAPRMSGFADNEQPAFLSAKPAKEAKAEAAPEVATEAEAAPKRTPRPRKPRVAKAAPEAAE